MNKLSINTIKFISEQDGEVEREFKQKISILLKNQNNLIRAYLAQIRYENNSDDFNVALCLKIDKKESQYIVEEAGNVFKGMFGRGEHLDIIILDEQQELVLREVCCPFYTSKEYQIKTPDFYLISSEGYSLQNPIKCYKRKKLAGKHPDGYMLCDISPSLDGSKYSVDGGNISQLVFASRHENYSLFPVKTWPSYVHVAVSETRNLINSFDLKASDIKLIAWGELYKEYSDIENKKA